MAKIFHTQKYEVTLTNGTKTIVCCAPAMTKLPVKAYMPIPGTFRVDVCCHTGHAADMCRKQTEQVRQACSKFGT